MPIWVGDGFGDYYTISGRSATLVWEKWLFFSHLTHTTTLLPPPLFPPGSSHANIYQQLLTHSAHSLHKYSTQFFLSSHGQTNKNIHIQSHKQVIKQTPSLFYPSPSIVRVYEYRRSYRKKLNATIFFSHSDIHYFYT